MINDLEKNGAKVNCFFHSWTVDCHVEESHGRRIEGSYVKVPLQRRNEMISALPFRQYCFENEHEVEPRLVLPPRAFLLDKQAAKKYIGMQLYSMQRSYEIMRQWERNNKIEHSTIVKLRFDTSPKEWNIREFFLSEDKLFAPMLIAANDQVHRHPGGGGGCLKCSEIHWQWWKKGGHDAGIVLPTHQGQHGNDICDLYAIGNRLTMERYMTVYSRATQLYSEELFNSSLEVVANQWRKPFAPCSVDENDIRLPLDGWEMEDEHVACFYPERLQRLNLEGFSVLHAASLFYRD